MQTSGVAQVVQGLNTAKPSVVTDESAFDHLHRMIGDQIMKSITLSASGGTESINIFSLTGSVEVLKLYGEVTNADTLANLTAGNFNLWDGAVPIALTKNTGVLSGVGVGSLFLKNAVAANNWAVADNATGVLTEPAAGVKAFTPFVVTQKTGVATYIRMTYTTTDAPIDAIVKIFCEFRTLDSGILVPV